MGFLANTIFKICNIMYTINQYIAVLDPDLEIRDGGGGESPKKNFSALRASVWSKTKGRLGPLGPLPWIRHCIVNILYIIIMKVFYVVYGKILNDMK